MTFLGPREDFWPSRSTGAALGPPGAWRLDSALPCPRVQVILRGLGDQTWGEKTEFEPQRLHPHALRSEPLCHQCRGAAPPCPAESPGSPVWWCGTPGAALPVCSRTLSLGPVALSATRPLAGFRAFLQAGRQAPTVSGGQRLCSATRGQCSPAWDRVARLGLAGRSWDGVGSRCLVSTSPRGPRA